jgi:hypothetical protein
MNSVPTIVCVVDSRFQIAQIVASFVLPQGFIDNLGLDEHLFKP